FLYGNTGYNPEEVTQVWHPIIKDLKCFINLEKIATELNLKRGWVKNIKVSSSKSVEPKSTLYTYENDIEVEKKIEYEGKLKAYYDKLEKIINTPGYVDGLSFSESERKKYILAKK